ncbi:MAG: hypothetical protein HY303_07560, partial [Candidatus Wallbacteria bacterium]|nr:hypothetical protein [Candidatus Wallbacteria bacterium]
ARGAGPGADAYHATYQLRLSSPEEAQGLKELLLEKLVFYKENAMAKAGVLAMDAVAIDAQGASVLVRGDADSTTATYNFLYAYVAFLLGYSQADSYLGIN